MKSPGFMGTLQDGPAGLAFNTATGRLFVATSSDAVYVRDTAKKNWIARLQYNLSKQTLPDDHVVTSSDGRWVAIAVTDCAPRTTSPSSVPGGPPAASTMQFVPHLLIFDLKSLNLPPVAPR